MSKKSVPESDEWVDTETFLRQIDKKMKIDVSPTVRERYRKEIIQKYWSSNKIINSITNNYEGKDGDQEQG